MNIYQDSLQVVRERRLILNCFDRWLFDEIQPFVGQRIFEIGCGLGNLTNHFLDRELLVSVDISEKAVAEVNKKYSSFNNILVFQKSIIARDVISLKSYLFDTAISLNVFEHIEDDELAIANTHAILETNGKFILIVPAHPQLFGTMDSSIGHFRRYTKTEASKRMEKAGFRIIKQKYINLVGAIGWYVGGRLLRYQVPPEGQLKVMNSLVPLLRNFENKVNVPFGISLLTVGEKNSSNKFF